MEQSNSTNGTVSASLPLTEGEIRMERRQDSAGAAQIEISYSAAKPLRLSEDELLALLQHAVQTGVLSAEFVWKLHDSIEI